jgi:hypothetical protein
VVVVVDDDFVVALVVVAFVVVDLLLVLVEDDFTDVVEEVLLLVLVEDDFIDVVEEVLLAAGEAAAKEANAKKAAAKRDRVATMMKYVFGDMNILEEAVCLRRRGEFCALGSCYVDIGKKKSQRGDFRAVYILYTSLPTYQPSNASKPHLRLAWQLILGSCKLKSTNSLKGWAALQILRNFERCAASQMN